MNDVFLCLGGNIGHRAAAIRAATLKITQRCGKILKSSALYESPAWGYNSANHFLNLVIRLQTPLAPVALLNTLKKIEKEAGRHAQGTGYADRLIDIDILFFNDVIIRTKKLQIPHPRLHKRRFVLKPLSEVAPKLIHPVLTKTVSTLLKTCADKSRVRVFNRAVKPFISIEGNIGAGKTTLAKQLATKLEAHYIAEEFEEIKLLPHFYRNPSKYAAALEKSFLTSRYQLLNKGLRLGRQTAIVSDFSIYRSLWFARVNLKTRDFRQFERAFLELRRKLREPDLVVYLEASTPMLKANIKKRGRPYEQNIATAYLKQLSNSYGQGITQLQGHAVLHIKVNNYGPRELAMWLKHIEKIVIDLFG